MTNWYPTDPEMYEDVQTRWQYFNVATKRSPEKRLQRLWHGSRDSARMPVQWDDSQHAGFTTGTPWFYVNDNYKEINVAAQEQDPDSVLNFYRQAIALRKSLSCVRYGKYQEYGKLSSKLYTYSREDDKQKILVVCSYSENQETWNVPAGFDMTKAQLILANYPQADAAASDRMTLEPYEARVYCWEK